MDAVGGLLVIAICGTGCGILVFNHRFTGSVGNWFSVIVNVAVTAMADIGGITPILAGRPCYICFMAVTGSRNLYIGAVPTIDAVIVGFPAAACAGGRISLVVDPVMAVCRFILFFLCAAAAAAGIENHACFCTAGIASVSFFPRVDMLFIQANASDIRRKGKGNAGRIHQFKDIQLQIGDFFSAGDYPQGDGKKITVSGNGGGGNNAESYLPGRQAGGRRQCVCKCAAVELCADKFK